VSWGLRSSNVDWVFSVSSIASTIMSGLEDSSMLVA